MLTLLVFDESTYEKVSIAIITYFWMFSLITTLISMPISIMPVKRYNYPSNVNFNAHKFIQTSTLKTISEPLINSAKCTLKIISLKFGNQLHIHIESNQWICIENLLSGFCFKITLTANEISITNHKVHGFLNGFQHIKNIKILQIDRLNVFSLTTWEPCFADITLSGDYCILLFQSTLGMPDHAQEKFMIVTAASMDILLHVKNKLSTSNSFWDIKILKIMQSDWWTAFSIIYNSRIRFSTILCFLQILISNYVVSFKTKKSHWWIKFISQNPRKILWSNYTFHENLTTFKKWTLNLT